LVIHLIKALYPLQIHGIQDLDSIEPANLLQRVLVLAWDGLPWPLVVADLFAALSDYPRLAVLPQADLH
jgi:hypothetical protein